MGTRPYRTETLVVGAGLAGIVTTLELLNRGRSVVLLEACSRERFGGQALDGFGGMLLVDTPEQRRLGIRDSPELLLQDWLRAANFPADERWGPLWAETYAERSRADVYDWLKALGIRFVPMVQWVERGNYGDGNSLPRYHIAWGSGRGVVQTVIRHLLQHPQQHLLNILFEHRFESLEWQNGRVVGGHGVGPEGPFTVEAEHTVLCSGGISGNLHRLRKHWDPVYGPVPDNLLSGTHPSANGALHDEVERIGGQVVNLHQMWNYAAGISHPEPEYPDHGLSLIPARSALWLDYRGRRIGPDPLITGFDTHDLCKRIGNLPGQYGWHVMNRRIAVKEIAVSGTDTNPAIRDGNTVQLLYETFKGNDALFNWLLDGSEDVVQAENLDALARKMNELTGADVIDVAGMKQDIAAYDAMIDRGPPFYNDDQLRKLQQLRQWRSDRMRTCNFQKILDAQAGPLIAIRQRLITRKSMGGMLTDLQSRVLDGAERPIPGLYAAGEAAGFGGGGISGIRSLEGTFLSNCVLNGRRAAASIAGAIVRGKTG